jgi:hypothetical protein
MVNNDTKWGMWLNNNIYICNGIRTRYRYFYKFLLYLVWSELVRVVEMSELWTWYKKVMKDDAASAYVLHPLGLPLSQFMRGWIKEI